MCYSKKEPIFANQVFNFRVKSFPEWSIWFTTLNFRSLSDSKVFKNSERLPMVAIMISS